MKELIAFQMPDIIRKNELASSDAGATVARGASWDKKLNNVTAIKRRFASHPNSTNTAVVCMLLACHGTTS